MANHYDNSHTPQENFFSSLPKIIYGLMKEIQRANALKALELKFKFNEEYDVTIEDVDRIMSTDPAGKYSKNDR